MSPPSKRKSGSAAGSEAAHLRHIALRVGHLKIEIAAEDTPVIDAIAAYTAFLAALDTQPPDVRIEIVDGASNNQHAEQRLT